MPLIAETISIHAPRAGGDAQRQASRSNELNFNPRPPCGGRRIAIERSETKKEISIHAPRAGGDRV